MGYVIQDVEIGIDDRLKEVEAESEERIELLELRYGKISR